MRPDVAVEGAGGGAPARPDGEYWLATRQATGLVRIAGGQVVTTCPYFRFLVGRAAADLPVGQLELLEAAKEGNIGKDADLPGL